MDTQDENETDVYEVLRDQNALHAFLEAPQAARAATHDPPSDGPNLLRVLALDVF